MFTIDLLKGRGIPVKSGPEGMVIAVTTLVLPVIITIVMLGVYLHTKIVISVQKQRISNYETKIGGLSDAVELQKSFEKEKDIINSCSSEVSFSIGRHHQWSPILATLVENMPDSVVFNQLSVDQRSVKRKVPGKDRQKMTDVTVFVRTLRMNVYGSYNSNCDEAIRDFRDRLRFSTLLGPKLEDIRVSQGFDKLQDEDVVSYEIDCVFKPGL